MEHPKVSPTNQRISLFSHILEFLQLLKE
jgi:hypothetical protein